MKTTTVVLSILVTLSNSAFANPFLDQFCEAKRASLAADYNKSMAALEVQAKEIHDLGALDSEVITNTYEKNKGDVIERIQKYTNEVNSVVPSSLQQNPHYLLEILQKYSLFDDFTGEFGGLFRKMYLALDKLPSKLGYEFFSATMLFRPYAGPNTVAIDAFIRLGKPLEITDDSLWDKTLTDLSGRRISQQATILLSITANGFDVKVKNSQTVISASKVSQLQFVENVLKAKFPECLQK